MIRILIVAATQPEIEPLFNGKSNGAAVVSSELKQEHQLFSTQSSLLKTHHSKQQTTLLVTGVGMVATAYALGLHLAATRYDLVINLGVAGSFDRSLALGEVVEITNDTFSELGAEDDARFLPIDHLGFGKSSFNAGTSLAALRDQFNISHPGFSLKHVTGVTVNTVHGNEHTIHQITSRLNPQVESMEGAAFFYACHQAGVPGLQIRAVSNYVEKRNRDNWQIGLAIKNLNTFAAELLNAL